MSTETSFRNVVEAIQSRYSQTPLIQRWKEATSSDPDPKPLAFWMRESNDLVNIVWVTRRDIKDITWFPLRKESSFSLILRSSIVGVEIFEEEGVATKFGLEVSGDYLVRVDVSAEHGTLYWIASNAKEAAELGQFVGQVVKVLSEG